MKIILKHLYILPLLGLLSSCSNQETLQTYYVDRAGEAEFMSIDLPSSLFVSNANLTEEEAKTMSSISKLNILAFQANESNLDKYAEEKAMIEKILYNGKYGSLVSFSDGTQGMELLVQESNDKIKEYIVYGYNDSLGFMIARLLGKNLNPNQMYDMMKLSDKLDMSALENFASQLDLPKDF